MLKFSEIFEFSNEKFRKIPILKEFEWFEWFGPSPIEPFNSASRRSQLPGQTWSAARSECTCPPSPHCTCPVRTAYMPTQVCSLQIDSFCFKFAKV